MSILQDYFSILNKMLLIYQTMTMYWKYSLKLKNIEYLTKISKINLNVLINIHIYVGIYYIYICYFIKTYKPLILFINSVL